MNTNIYEDFQICISVPLSDKNILVLKFDKAILKK